MVTGEAAVASFRLAEQRAAAEFGLTITERFLAIGTPVGKARVIEAGSGTPVLFVHGGGGFAGHWLPLLAHVSGHRMVAPARPGCGLTARFHSPALLTTPRHAPPFPA